MKKYVVITIVVIAVSAYWLFDLDQYLTLEGVKADQAQLAGWRYGSPFLAGFTFFALYIAVTSLFLTEASLSRDDVHVMTGHKALRCEKDGEIKFIVVEHEVETSILKHAF